MTYHYYVAVDAAGIAGLAATKLSVVQEEAAEKGAEVISVDTQNVYEAQLQAVDAWNARHPHH